MNFFTELSKRWNQDSPAFFDKLKSFGIWLTATGIAIVGVPAAYNALIGPLNIDTSSFDLSLLTRIASYMILAGTVITAVSKTTVKNPNIIKK